MPGACWLRPCARSLLKNALCHTCSLGGASNKYHSMTRILYKYFVFQHSSPLSHFHLQSQHTLSCVTFRENTLTLSIWTNRVNTLFLLFTFDFQQSTGTKMYVPGNHSLPCYTFSVRLCPASNTEILSNHRKKQTVEILSQHA